MIGPTINQIIDLAHIPDSEKWTINSDYKICLRSGFCQFYFWSRRF